MSSPTEQLLREAFAAEAGAAPEGVDLAGGALRKVRRRRRIQAALATGAVGIVAVVAGVLATAAPGRQPPAPPIAAPTHARTGASMPSADPAAGPSGDGPVPFGGAEDCVEAYSPAAVAGRAFAFDGRVTAIGPTVPDRPDRGPGLVAVTFRVNQWFRGGSGATATAEWYPPGQGDSNTDPSMASYGVGSRLLVSGEPRWGGAPLKDAIAWSCGFTRYYDPQTAADWAAATR
jgi:hypothetical protein